MGSLLFDEFRKKTMRLMVYNLRYGTGTGAHFHLPFPMAGLLLPTRTKIRRISEFIKNCRPDVLCLVEVDQGSFLRCNRCSQVETIANELGHCAHTALKYRPGSLVSALPIMRKQSNAILTREAPVTQSMHYLRHGVKRLVLDVNLPEVRIFLVHLSLRREHRAEQLDQIAGILKNVRKPHIVAGDFNAFAGDVELKPFFEKTGLRNASSGGQPSWPSWAPRHQLDFILHSPEITVTKFRVPTVRFSDHYPLVCDFTVKTG